MQAAPELKRELREQARKAGLPVSEWVRARLEIGDISPSEVRAFLNALADLGERIGRSNARANARAGAHGSSVNV